MQKSLTCNRRWRSILPAFLCATLYLLVAITTTVVSAQEAEYGEAPQLAQQVEAGELPPVDERLPENPLVVPVVERIGDYGGTWRTGLVGGGDGPWLARTLGTETLVRWNPEWTTIIPGIAESYEVSEDAREFTFYLREGIKWSDGHPFTADDIVFWYEDVFMNSELTPVYATWLTSGGEPLTVEKLNDTTVVFRFAEPNGLFVERLASALGTTVVITPRHYLEQFHIRYNPDGIDELISQAGANEWVSLFQQKSDIWANSEIPTLNAWALTVPYDGLSTRVVAERNPYYWKVDPEGNQLPYLDRVTFDLVEETELLLLKALAGDIDMQMRHINLPVNKSLFIDNMERGDYRLFDVVSAFMNPVTFHFNLTHQDPVKREIFNNKDFRIGLSHAINRQEIIDLLQAGQGEPWQAAPRPESPLYNERLAKQYTEYDVDLANEYLDRAGYAERDSEGYRLGPDGNRITLLIDNNLGRVDRADISEIVQPQWQAVGIDVQLRMSSRTVWYVRKENNEHDVIGASGVGGLDVIFDPRNYFPYSHESDCCTLWAQWYNNDPRGEEPPPGPRRQMELYDQLVAEGDPERRAELMREILEIAADEFYAIGITLPAPGYGIVKNNFRNVPESIFTSGVEYNDPAPTNPSQYFIEGGGQ